MHEEDWALATACLTGPQLSEVKAGGGRKVGLRRVSCKAPAGGIFSPTQLSCCNNHQTQVGQRQVSVFWVLSTFFHKLSCRQALSFPSFWEIWWESGWVWETSSEASHMRYRLSPTQGAESPSPLFMALRKGHFFLMAQKATGQKQAALTSSRC